LLIGIFGIKLAHGLTLRTPTIHPRTNMARSQRRSFMRPSL
jgi:hypothetical protein